MNLKFAEIDPADLPQYKADMQEAFQRGAEEGGYPADDEVILPEDHIDRALRHPDSVAYKAVLNGQMVGGAIVTINRAAQNGYLDFLYTKHSVQGKGVGKFLWFAIEKRHPDIVLWETCTPYFERRNIHFYINVCGFHAIEFFHARHPDPNAPEDYVGDDDFGMFAFQKTLK